MCSCCCLLLLQLLFAALIRGQLMNTADSCRFDVLSFVCSCTAQPVIAVLAAACASGDQHTHAVKASLFCLSLITCCFQTCCKPCISRCFLQWLLHTESYRRHRFDTYNNQSIALMPLSFSAAEDDLYRQAATLGTELYLTMSLSSCCFQSCCKRCDSCCCSCRAACSCCCS